MSDNTLIEWADATVNAVNGCSVLSPGCTNCYAMKLAGTRLKHHPSRAGLTTDSKSGPVWNGTVRLNEDALMQPLRWKRPRRIFWNAHGDLFHEAVPDEWIDRVFAVCALTPQHTHMILTKRTGRMRKYFATLRKRGDVFAEWADWIADVKGITEHPFVPEPEDFPLPNVWLGTSVEDQTRADDRIPHLLATPAAVRFLSCEPLLGPVDLRWIAEPDERKSGVIDALLGCNWIDASFRGGGAEFRPARPGHQDRVMRRWVCSSEAHILANRKLDWVIVGGESGHGARPMHPDWARSLRDQCAEASVPFFMKQWGEWAPHPTGEPVTIRQYHASIGYIDRDTGARKSYPNRHTDETMRRIGKKKAGRLLDGRLHSDFPA